MTPSCPLPPPLLCCHVCHTLPVYLALPVADASHTRNSYFILSAPEILLQSPHSGGRWCMLLRFFSSNNYLWGMSSVYSYKTIILTWIIPQVSYFMALSQFAQGLHFHFTFPCRFLRCQVSCQALSKYFFLCWNCIIISLFFSLFQRTLKALILERSTFITHHGAIFLSGNLLGRKWYVFLYLIFLFPQAEGYGLFSSEGCHLYQGC